MPLTYQQTLARWGGGNRCERIVEQIEVLKGFAFVNSFRMGSNICWIDQLCIMECFISGFSQHVLDRFGVTAVEGITVLMDANQCSEITYLFPEINTIPGNCL